MNQGLLDQMALSLFPRTVLHISGQKKCFGRGACVGVWDVDHEKRYCRHGAARKTNKKIKGSPVSCQLKGRYLDSTGDTFYRGLQVGSLALFRDSPDVGYMWFYTVQNDVAGLLKNTKVVSTRVGDIWGFTAAKNIQWVKVVFFTITATITAALMPAGSRLIVLMELQPSNASL